MEWRKMDSAPRDGREMLVRTISRGWGASAPTYRYDIAVWVGKTDDSTGRFAARSGAICTHWKPLEPPKDEDV